MLIKNKLSVKEENVLKTTKDLLYSSEFHVIVDTFCRKAVDEGNELTYLINSCFNEKHGGHDNVINVSKISNILLNVYHRHFVEYDKVFANDELKACFKRFLGALYNFYFSEYAPCLIDENVLDKELHTNLQIKRNQNMLNLVMDSYSTIIKNIEKHEFIRRANDI